MAGFKVDYDSMAKFDAMPKDEQNQAWEQLSGDQQQAVAAYHPKYVQEKATRVTQSPDAIIKKAVSDGEEIKSNPALWNQKQVAVQNSLPKDFNAMSPSEQSGHIKDLLDKTASRVNKTRNAESFPSKVVDAAKIGLDPDHITYAGKDVIEPIARAGTQGLSYGLSDEMKGAGQVYDTLRGLNPGKVGTESYNKTAATPSEYVENLGNLGNIYRSNQFKDQQANKDAEKQSPSLYAGSEFVSSLFAPGPGSVKAASKLGAAAKGAAIGAPLAITSALGHSDKPLSETSAEDIAIPGVIGVGLGGAGGFFGKALSNYAENKAVSSIGANVPKLRSEGINTPEKVQGFGRNLLDEGLVPVIGGKSKANQLAGARTDEIGKPIGEYMSDTDKLIQDSGNAQRARSGADDARAAKDMADKQRSAYTQAQRDVALGNVPRRNYTNANPESIQASRDLTHELNSQAAAAPYNPGLNYDKAAEMAWRELPHDNVIAQKAQGKAEELINAFKEQGKLTPGSFGAGWNAKTAAQSAQNFSDQAPLAQDIAHDVTRGFKNNVVKQAQFARNAAEAMMTKGLSKEQAEKIVRDNTNKSAAFKELLKRYGTAATAEKMSRGPAISESLQSGIGLGRSMAAAGGGALGGPAGALTGYLLSNPNSAGLKAHLTDLASKGIQNRAPISTVGKAYSNNDFINSFFDKNEDKDK